MDSEALIAQEKKRWISPEFRIAFRIVWCFFLFLAIVERWTRTEDLMEQISDPSSLNPSYAKSIEIETYLMTQSQLKQLFPPSEGAPLAQWKEHQTSIINDSSPLYLVLRLRNRGDSYAWGRLETHANRWGRGSGIEERTIPVQSLPPQMKDFKVIILAASHEIRGFESSINDQAPASITTEWLSLYTSKSEVNNEQ